MAFLQSLTCLTRCCIGHDTFPSSSRFLRLCVDVFTLRRSVCIIDLCLCCYNPFPCSTTYIPSQQKRETFKNHSPSRLLFPHFSPPVQPQCLQTPYAGGRTPDPTGRSFLLFDGDVGSRTWACCCARGEIGGKMGPRLPFSERGQKDGRDEKMERGGVGCVDR